MKFATHEDIDAPIQTVFDSATDFDGFERQMLRRGIDVAHDEALPPPMPGARWRISLPWRNRTYEIDADLLSVDEGVGYAIEAKSGGVNGLAVVDLVALSKSRTRLFVSLDLRASSFGSRLLLQSLRLTKSSLTKRFNARIHAFSRSVPTDD